jgi:hypothetical protein
MRFAMFKTSIISPSTYLVPKALNTLSNFFTSIFEQGSDSLTAFSAVKDCIFKQAWPRKGTSCRNKQHCQVSFNKLKMAGAHNIKVVGSPRVTNNSIMKQSTELESINFE